MRTFKGYVPATVPRFTIESADGTRTLEVRCKPSVPGSVLLNLMSQAKDQEDIPAMARSTRDTIDLCLADDQMRTDFWAFCDEPTNGIDLELLGEIMGYLAELFSERPTTPPQP